MQQLGEHGGTDTSWQQGIGVALAGRLADATAASPMIPPGTPAAARLSRATVRSR
ncbi:hypothetical protein ACIRS3_28680 [Streptomyces virginiae]|uniref:hypothetical protein n=1 Tax=Streptomyces virginiae TaxID=1961 RepID=UPI0037FF5DFF